MLGSSETQSRRRYTTPFTNSARHTAGKRFWAGLGSVRGESGRRTTFWYSTTSLRPVRKTSLAHGFPIPQETFKLEWGRGQLHKDDTELVDIAPAAFSADVSNAAMRRIAGCRLRRCLKRRAASVILGVLKTAAVEQGRKDILTEDVLAVCAPGLPACDPAGGGGLKPVRAQNVNVPVATRQVIAGKGGCQQLSAINVIRRPDQAMQIDFRPPTIPAISTPESVNQGVVEGFVDSLVVRACRAIPARNEERIGHVTIDRHVRTCASVKPGERKGALEVQAYRRPPHTPINRQLPEHFKRTEHGIGFRRAAARSLPAISPLAQSLDSAFCSVYQSGKGGVRMSEAVRPPLPIERRGHMA